MSIKKVLIADGREKVRFALNVLLGREEFIEVVGEAVAADSLMQQIQICSPDLILVDWGLPGLADGPSLQAIRQKCPNAALIVLSGRPEAEEEAVLAGADAFVNKTESPAHLLSVIRAHS